MIVFIGVFVIGLIACSAIGIAFGLVTAKEDFWMGFTFSLLTPLLVGIYYVGKALVGELNLM